MKKSISILARVLVAVLGIGFIAMTVDWTDKVLVPAEVVMPGYGQVDEPTKFAVVEGFDELIEADKANGAYADDVTLRVRVNETEQVLTIAGTQVGLGDDDYQAYPGLIKMVKQSDKKMLLLGLVLVGFVLPLQSVRWWLLLKSQAIHVPVFKAFKLTMIGTFFNFCMPGSTGGDLVKAYYAAKGSGRRTSAVMTVVFDRVAGLLGLVVLAAIAGLFILEHPLARQVTLYVWLLVIGVVVASALYFSKRLRKVIKLDVLISKLPGKQFFGSIDEAAVAYAHHKPTVLMTVGLSVLVHICLVSATSLAGYALGINVGFGLLLVVLPVLMLAGAMPLTYQGLGVMEGLAMAFLLGPDTATANQLVGMLLMFRLYLMAYGLVGTVFLLQGDIHLHPQEVASEGEPVKS